MKNNFIKDFPILENNNLIYLDNSSTTLKPTVVIDAINDFYNKYTSNAYRGDYLNSEIVSLKIDECRNLVSIMLNCSPNEIIFTSNCTDSINLISNMLKVTKRDKIICSILEHHSNLLPWVEKANVITINIDTNGIVKLEDLERELQKNKVKIVSITATSNVTGNIQPIEKICELAHKYNSLVILDCCQYIPHMDIDVRKVNCDFLVFSAHKMCGPSGVGIIYGKKEILKKCRKPKFGGGMVDKIFDLSNIRYKEIPFCFEAGTPPIENILGFAAAIRYYLTVDYKNIISKNKELNDYFYSKAKKCKKIKLLFPVANNHVPIFTFELSNPNLNIHYIAKILSDAHNICVSAGYQCCQPLYNSINKKGGIRVSLQFYNTKEEIDCFFSIIDNLEI